MIVVSDTSPLLALFYLGKLNLLELLFRDIVIPEGVYNELLHSKLSETDKLLFTLSPFQIVKTENKTEVQRLLAAIQLGEAEAIVLSEQLHADLLLIDETVGRNIASQRGIKIVGVLGILIDSKQNNHIVAVKPLMDQLILEINFRISPNLYHKILKICNEL